MYSPQCKTWGNLEKLGSSGAVSLALVTLLQTALPFEFLYHFYSLIHSIDLKALYHWKVLPIKVLHAQARMAHSQCTTLRCRYWATPQ